MIARTLEQVPDLDNPLWELGAFAVLLWLTLALLWLHDRAKHRRTASRRVTLDAPAEGADAAVVDPRGRGADAGSGRVRNDDVAGSGIASEARAEDRGVRQVRSEQHRLLALHRLDLTDAELLAVARYLDRQQFRLPEPALGDLDLVTARDSIARAALDIVHGDRAGRRK